MTYLLDADVLIALVVANHEHHDRAARWARDAESIALCPIVEGALVRFLVRTGETPATAKAVLEAMHDSARCEFWEDSFSYSAADLDHVTGHRQVTDTYLAALAQSRHGRLATFDRGLAKAHPAQTTLIP
ncbi:TA system VapC family ribonuclease toxin [Microlunatus parietis]|uniref:Ribonuclease VapC n=1 Tax=Microlunatus parietis TaxID=682979 RepID=A0A7Y9LBI3_9ACTN|nr:TA system VapC family ribonuclease toxin [Microlunatus parietis]NYE71762.1 hypothetical protein [Microlunatus parietis]